MEMGMQTETGMGERGFEAYRYDSQNERELLSS